MVIREEIEINAPLNVVWRIFSQMKDWDSRNTACRSAGAVKRGEKVEQHADAQRYGKPMMGPVPKRKRARSVIRVVTCESMMIHRAFS